MEKTNEQNHREMWRWLAKNPHKEKIDYFEEKSIKETPENLCYACEEAGYYACEEPGFNYEEDDINCVKCPLDMKKIGCDGGLYDDWWREENLDKRAELAAKIAELPWRSK